MEKTHSETHHCHLDYSRHMNRFYVMPFVLALLLATIFILPRRGEVMKTSLSYTAIDLEHKAPPTDLGDWIGEASLPSDKEVSILNPDTNFIKGNYTSYDMPTLSDASGQLFRSVVNLSIVISGFDINNSIHRPERCLRAQGHLEMLSLPDTIKTPQGHEMKIQRLTSIYPIAPKEEGGRPFPIGFVSYYYFVGHKNLTHDHWMRTFIDMKDRLLYGADQQWSFVMVSMPYNIGSTAEETQKRQEQADKKIRQFLGELSDRIIDWPQIPSW